MKKLLSIATVASTLAAFAGGEIVVKVGSVGVTEIDSDTANTIVAISYDNLVGTAGEMIVSNLVKTTNLTKGDKLIAYDGSKYETWVLAGDDPPHYWEKNSTKYTLTADGLSEASGTSASEVAQAWGSGIWLIRLNYSDPFYIYGKPSSSSVYTCAQGTTLVGNPTQIDSKPMIGNPSNGDVVAVPADNTLGKVTYTYNSKKGGWVTFDDQHMPVVADSLPEIPAGTGFWYVAKGTGTTISW